MSDYTWLNKESRLFLSRGYLSKDETPEERFRAIAERAEDILKMPGYADKLEQYIKNGWYSLASPVISNFGKERGLPISCNGSVVEDSMESIMYKVSEIAMMSKNGAGTSVYLSKLRPRGAKISAGGESSGPAHFAEIFDTVTSVVSQSSVRRGACAAYLDAEHPDILEFLNLRNEGSEVQDLSLGVCISDKFMNSLKKKNKKNLKVWGEIVKKKYKSGYPYIFFTDNVNREAPDVYKDKGMKIEFSNLCSEIALAVREDESFVCDLSSMNLVLYDEWKDTDAVEVLIYLLDAVMTEYIQKVEKIPYMKHAYNFAVRQRALGVGVLGWHTYLQKNMIPFESMQAKYKNTEIWKLIKEKGEVATKNLAVWFGEPELLKGYGRRNVTLFAVAPTTSSSFILGQVSPSVEPLKSNYFTKDLAKGDFGYKNPVLTELLKEKGKNTRAVWDSILVKGGSVQHLDFLSDVEKDVFKTAGELSQKEILIQAIGRQKYIDQTQSINVFVHPETPAKEVSDLLVYAWENGIKTLYYQRGANPAQELIRKLSDCVSCES